MDGVACLDLVILLLIIILGAGLGSFYNVLIDRLPRKQSIILPASHCSDCGKSLPVWLNIPILSYILLKGKCKYCGAKIHIHHLLVEIISPLILIALFLKYGTELLMFAKYAVLFGFLIPVFFIDLYHKLILDKLTVPMAVIGLIFSFLPGHDIGFPDALITGAVSLLLLLGLAWMFEKVRHKEGLGGGDIKLLAALGTFLGGINLAFTLLLGSVIALVYALADSKMRKQGIAFGPFLVLAACFVVLWGEGFLNWYLNIL